MTAWQDTNLEVEFAGVRMRSPLGVAAQAPFAPPSISVDRMVELLLKHVDEGAGYVHTPYVNAELAHPADKLPTGRFLRAETKLFGKQGMWCTADSYRIEMRLDAGLRLVDRLKKAVPDGVAVIANIMGPGADPDAWAEHAAKFETAGADLIELDVSCPLPASALGAVESYVTERIPEHAGVLLGDIPALTAAVTAAAAKRCGVPVGVKFSPETGFPRLVSFAEQVKDAGAKFITSINAPLSVAPPDIYNGGRSLYPALDANPISPALGPWTRYLCYRNIGTISLFVPGIDQAAVGGLVEGKHVVESMMLGAKICEFSSGTLWRGWSLLRRSAAFLVEYMKEQEYASLDDFRDLGVQYMMPADLIDWGVGRVAAAVDAGKCTGCGICCHNLCWAMSLDGDGDIASCSEELCGACGLCVAVCPENAVTLEAAAHTRTEQQIYAALADAEERALQA